MIPVGDFLRTRTTPFVNWSLIAINIAVFVYMLSLDTRPDQLLAGMPASQADRFIFDWGFVPACFGEFFGHSTGVDPEVLQEVCPTGNQELIQPVTSMFLHGGWAHIIGNMWTLWILLDLANGWGDRLRPSRRGFLQVGCSMATAS
jgi:membrane associated rhomboid family serine protease